MDLSEVVKKAALAEQINQRGKCSMWKASDVSLNGVETGATGRRLYGHTSVRKRKPSSLGYEMRSLIKFCRASLVCFLVLK
jgi:hypothetical protein